MKKDQKLFDLFKDNEHKLHEYPSADAWHRLEQRLDAHRRRRRIAAYRPIAMAAAITLVVGMVATFSWVSHTLNRQKAQAHAHFVLLEDLPPAESSNVYAQNLALRQKYDDADLVEGDSHKRFHVNQPRQAPSEASTSANEMPELKITAADSSPFSWLSGAWRSVDSDTPVFEEWTFLGGQQFETVIYTLENGRKQILENQQFRVQAQGPNQVRIFTSESHATNVQYKLQGDTLIREENGSMVRKMRRE